MYCQFYAVGVSVPSPVTAISRSIARSRKSKALASSSFVQEEVRQNTAARAAASTCAYCSARAAGGSPLVGKNKPHVRSKILMRCYCFCESYRQLETFQTDQYVLDHESGLLCYICKHNQFSLKKAC